MRFRLVAPFLLTAQIAAAQSEPTTGDSAGRDTTARRAGDAYGLLVVYAIMALAPPAPLLIPGEVARQRQWSGYLPDNFLVAYEAIGYAGNQNADGWGRATDVYGLAHHLYAEVRVQDWYSPTHVAVRTFRAGYLFHPAPRAIGGVTLGYRTAEGAWREDRADSPTAVEVGFPVLCCGPKETMRIEPIYAISAQGVSWTYRWETVFYVPGTGLVTGFDVDAKPLRQGGPYFVTMQLLFGLRR